MKGKTLFVNPDTHIPFPDQHNHLSRIKKVSGDWLAEIIELNGLKERAARPSGPAKGKVFSGDLLPCAKRMLEGVTEGCRDMAAFRLAIHLKSRGSSIKGAEQILQEWNATRNRPPLSPRVITVKVRSAYLRGYSGFGCEDSLIVPFCSPSCPILQKNFSVKEEEHEKRKKENIAVSFPGP